MTSFASEAIIYLGVFPVTNTLLHTLFVDILLLSMTFFLTKRIRLIPSFFQNTVELTVETFYALTESVAKPRVDKIFPYFITFFIFIFFANLTSLLPGFGSVGFFREKEFIPVLRGATSDINTTLGLAFISAFATHMLSVQALGIKEYLSRYFSLNPLNLFIGILEIISEITKVISLSFRLFGNIFAGEVVLSKIFSMFAFLIPLPFLMLELIVGFVQALVFSMLTMAFMAILTTPHNPEHEEVKST